MKLKALFGALALTILMATPAGASGQDIEGAFERCLGRTPTPGAIAYWSTVENAAAKICDSYEARARGVKRAYRGYLGREVTPQALRYWTSMPLDDAEWGIAWSAEALERWYHSE